MKLNTTARKLIETQNQKQNIKHDDGGGEGISLGTFSLVASNRRSSNNLLNNLNMSKDKGNSDGEQLVVLSEENRFKPSHHFLDSGLEKQFKFNRSKINYLENSLFVREEGTNIPMGEEHVTLYFTNVNTKEQVHVSGIRPEYLNGLHCIHRFFKSGNTHFYHATCRSVLMIIEAGRVVYAVDLQPADNTDEKITLKYTINDVKVREGNTESNINFYYFILSTNSGFKIIKWERIHKDNHKVVIEYTRDERRVLQTSLIRELLCVVWEDGVQVYKIAFAKGKITPLSNLLLCGGCVTSLFSIENTIEAEGWIVVQDSSSLIPNMKPNLNQQVNELDYPEQTDDDMILIKPKSTISNSLILPELQQKLEFEHTLLTQTVSTNPTTTSPRIAYLKIEDNNVKINSEDIKLKTLSADLCHCVHDRLQSPIIHIVVANRSAPHIEYVEYNYKTQATRYQIIELPKEQRLLGLDIGHGNPSVDSILIVRSLSGEKANQHGFFFTTLQHASQHYKNAVFNKFLRELEKPPEDPNLQTPITPNIGHSPSDLFPSTNIQQQVVLNTILRELREMKNSIDFKLDKITHELLGLDKRVHNIENILSHSNHEPRFH